MTLDPDDLPEVAEIEHALLVVDLVLVQIQPVDQALAHSRLDVTRDLEPDDLAEAPAAQLVLDRGEQVVGLVGDVEVGVARDAEEAVGDDLHAGKQRVQVLGDDVLERDERALADLDKARQHLLRDLHARVELGLERRVVQVHEQAQRQVRDVGKRPARTDRQRRQHREDVLEEVALEPRRGSPPTPRRRRCGCPRRQVPA